MPSQTPSPLLIMLILAFAAWLWFKWDDIKDNFRRAPARPAGAPSPAALASAPAPSPSFGPEYLDTNSLRYEHRAFEAKMRQSAYNHLADERMDQRISTITGGIRRSEGVDPLPAPSEGRPPA